MGSAEQGPPQKVVPWRQKPLPHALILSRQHAKLISNSVRAAAGLELILTTVPALKGSPTWCSKKSVMHSTGAI
jgi:hypothetical protein